MNPFQEALQKGMGEGLAKGILRGIELVLVIAGGFLLCQKPIVALVLLAIAAILLLLLVTYAFGWWSSYRKTRQRIEDLENRVAPIEAERQKSQRDVEAAHRLNDEIHDT